MKLLNSFNLMEYGFNVGMETVLPILIKFFEPEQAENIEPSIFESKETYTEVATGRFLTVYEVQNTVENYKIINFFSIYFMIFCIPLIAYLISLLFRLVSIIWTAPDWFVSIIMFICIFAFFIFWLGIHFTIVMRKGEWEEDLRKEKTLERIEYYAVMTSSKVIADILLEIENLRETQKKETERIKSYGKKRSLLDKDLMEKFNSMLDERERVYRRKGNIKAMGLWLIGVLMGYAIERALDIYVLGTTPTVGSTNK